MFVTPIINILKIYCNTIIYWYFFATPYKSRFYEDYDFLSDI